MMSVAFRIQAFLIFQDAKVRKIPSNQNFASLTTGGGTKPLADIEKRKKGKLRTTSILTGTVKNMHFAQISHFVFVNV